MSTLQPTDKVLVNRAGTPYSTSSDMSTIQDTDMIVVNRGGTSYKCTAADWRQSNGGGGVGLPKLGTITLSDVVGGTGRFTNSAFPLSLTMTENGNPPSDKRLRAYVEGMLKVPGRTSDITSVGSQYTYSQFGGTSSDQGNEAEAIAVFNGTGNFGYSTGALNAHKTWNFTVPIPVKAGETVTVQGFFGDGFSYNVYFADGHSTGGSGSGPQTRTYTPTADTGISALTTASWGAPAQYSYISSIRINGQTVPQLELRDLTLLTDKDFNLLVRGDVIKEDATESVTGQVILIDPANKTLSVTTTTGAWAVSQRIRGPEKAIMTTPETDVITSITHWGNYLAGISAINGPVGGSAAAIFDGDINNGTQLDTNYDWAGYSLSRPITGNVIEFFCRAVSHGSPVGAPSLRINGYALYVVPTMEGSWVRINETSVNSFEGNVNAGGSTGCYAIRVDGRMLTETPVYSEIKVASNKDLNYFTVGQTVTEGGNGDDGTGTITAILTDGFRLSTVGGTWDVGSTVVSTTDKPSESVRLYAVLDSNQNVLDFRFSDPGFTAWSPQTTDPFTETIKFPAILPTGNPPDVDLPDGTTLTVDVKASNAGGTDTAASNTITPF
jgi:hypothetical protein